MAQIQSVELNWFKQLFTILLENSGRKPDSIVQMLSIFPVPACGLLVPSILEYRALTVASLVEKLTSGSKMKSSSVKFFLTFSSGEELFHRVLIATTASRK